jgi:hypothetical protein
MLSSSFSVWVMWLCTNETFLHAKSIEETCLSSARWWFAVLLRVLTLLHYSRSFIVLWCLNRTCRAKKNLFTTLPWILKLSAIFEVALHERILPCLGTSNTWRTFFHLHSRLSFTINSHSKNAMIHHSVLHKYKTTCQDMCAQYFLSPLHLLAHSSDVKYITSSHPIP